MATQRKDFVRMHGAWVSKYGAATVPDPDPVPTPPFPVVTNPGTGSVGDTMTVLMSILISESI